MNKSKKRSAITYASTGVVYDTIDPLKRLTQINTKKKSKKSKGPSYSQVGDDYDKKDPLKVIAQTAASETSNNLRKYGYKEISASRGESAHVIDLGNIYLASVPEGLGTKNLVADAIYSKDPKKSYYYEVGIDTVATIVNDLITVGAQPLVVNAHWAIGDNDWLNDKKRFRELCEGWAEGCNRAGAIYGGGETPTLQGIIFPDKSELSGAAVGIINPKSRLTLGEKLSAGDHIVFIASNGIQTNGLSLARHVANVLLSNGYQTKLPNGKTFGEALMSPSYIYAKLMLDLFENEVQIHSMVHMTGHGLRKVMRSNREFTYRISYLPTPQDEFLLMQSALNYTEEDMYSIFNMGIGFAFFVPNSDTKKVIKIAKIHKFEAWDAGVVEKGPRQVIIEPKDIVFAESTLQIR